jgi:hypothetical protein
VSKLRYASMRSSLHVLHLFGWAPILIPVCWPLKYPSSVNRAFWVVGMTVMLGSAIGGTPIGKRSDKENHDKRNTTSGQ